MNPTFLKTVGTSAALLLFLGAGCSMVKSPAVFETSVSNADTPVESQTVETVLWRTVKNDFAIRVPKNWIVEQRDAGGMSLVLFSAPGSTQPDIQVRLTGVGNPPVVETDIIFRLSNPNRSVIEEILQTLDLDITPAEEAQARIIP